MSTTRCDDDGDLTMNKGEATPITVYFSSKHGETVTGLTATGFLARTKGGEAITDPATAYSFTEDTSTSATRRRYKARVTSTIGDAMIAAKYSSLYAAVVVEGVVRRWIHIRVVGDAVIS